MSTRTPIVLLILSAAFLCTAGCEDEEASARAEAHEQLSRASLEYSKAVRADDPQAALNAFGQSAPSAASPGASGVIQTLAKRQAAAIQIAQASALEAENRASRNDVQGIGHSIARLRMLAEGHADFESRVDRSTLDDYRAAAQQRLQVVSEQISQTEGPLNEIRVQNQRDRQQIEGWRSQANDLRQRAFELGDLEGFGATQQAVGLDRGADEAEAAVRERELTQMTLESQMRLAKLRQVQLQAQIDAVAQAEADIAEVGGIHGQTAATLGDEARKLQSTVNDSMSDITSRQNELDSVYNSILSTLQGAASSSSAAGDAGRAMRMRIHQTEAQVHTMRARGLQEQAIINETVGSGGNAAQEAREAFGAAAEAYTEAGNSVAGSSGDAATLKAMFNAAAQGKPLETMPSSGGNRSSAGGGGGLVYSGSGASSPQELISSLKNARTWEELIARSMDTAYMELGSDVEVQAMNAVKQTMNSALGLSAAMRDQFGAGLVDALMVSFTQQMGGGEMEVEMPTVAEITRGIELTQSGGGPAMRMVDPSGTGEEITVPLIEKDGRWYLEATDDDALQMTRSPLGGGMPEMNPETAEQILMMTRAIDPLISRYAARVRSGEFATVEEFFQSVMQEMGPMMQGFGGGGFSGG